MKLKNKNTNKKIKISAYLEEDKYDKLRLKAFTLRKSRSELLSDLIDW